MPPIAPRRRSWWDLVKLAVLLAMFGFAAVAIVRNWAAVEAAIRQLSPWAVVASVPFAVLAMLAALGVWRSLMADFGAPLPLRGAARIFFLSVLGKYVPGSVWSVLAQIELGREYHVPRRTSLTVGVLAIVMSASVGVPLAAVMLPLAAPEAARRFWWALLPVPLLLALLHPKVLAWALNLVFRVVRRPPLPHPPSWSGLLKAAGWQTLVWVLLGLHAWLLIIGIGGSPGRSLPIAIGGYALGYSIGLFAIGMPAGAGVREAALFLAFSAVIPKPAAAVVVLLSRAVLTLVDLTLAGAQYALRRPRR